MVTSQVEVEEVELTEEERKKVEAEFKEHYKAIEDSWRKPTVSPSVKKGVPSKVIYCIWCYRGDFDGAKTCIERVQPGVDAVCVVGNDLTDQQAQWLKDKGCIVKLQLFNDNFIEQRNTYLEMARKLAKDPWVLISDPDEFFNEAIVRDLKEIVVKLEEEGYNAAGINCHEEFKEAELTDESDLKSYHQIYSEGRESNYYKILLFKAYADLRYKATGEMRVLHETWGSPTQPTRAVYLDKKYKYHHKKSPFRMWRNSARNVFMAGGGNSVGSVNTAWVALRRICYSLGITSWQQFEAYMDKGNIDEQLLQWILDNMVNNAIDYISETTQISKWYFSMHSEEWNKLGKPKVKYQPTKEGEAEYGVVRAFLDVLGRHPDEGARRHYTEAVLNGRIELKELPNILMQSTEYYDKFRLSTSKLGGEVGDYVRKCFLDVLKREPDSYGHKTYVEAILNGKIRKEDLPNILRNSPEWREKFGKKS